MGGLKRDNSVIQRNMSARAGVRLSLLFLMALTVIGTLMLEPTINSLLGGLPPPAGVVQRICFG